MTYIWISALHCAILSLIGLSTPPWRSRITDLSYLVLSILFFTIIIFSDNIKLDLYVIGLTCANLALLHKFKWRVFLFTLLLIIPTWLSFYLASFIYVGVHAQSTHNLATLLTVRLSAISITSLMFTSAIDFEELLLFSMQKLKLSVLIAYPLLSAINALASIKSEYQRIQLVYQMRFNRKIYILPMIFPLIISAVRYAYYNGLSLECRGLNHHKTFIHAVKPFTWVDVIWLLLNMLAVVLFYML
jgi:hypothetical protein